MNKTSHRGYSLQTAQIRLLPVHCNTPPVLPQQVCCLQAPPSCNASRNTAHIPLHHDMTWVNCGGFCASHKERKIALSWDPSRGCYTADAASLFHRGQALPTSWPADQESLLQHNSHGYNVSFATYRWSALFLYHKHHIVCYHNPRGHRDTIF